MSVRWRPAFWGRGVWKNGCECMGTRPRGVPSGVGVGGTARLLKKAGGSLIGAGGTPGVRFLLPGVCYRQIAFLCLRAPLVLRFFVLVGVLARITACLWPPANVSILCVLGAHTGGCLRRLVVALDLLRSVMGTAG